MKSGWVTKKLGEVCEFSKENGNWRGLAYIGLEDIESKTARFIGSPNPRTVQSLTFRFHPGQVLYGRLRPYLQKALLAEVEGHCSTEIFPIQPTNELVDKYLLHWLLSDDITAKIDATCRGARMPRANMNEVLDFDIPIPPLSEQKRIVAKIDAAFEKIDALKANAEKNLANAKELFQSALDEAMRPKKGWVEKRLGELGETLTGMTPSTKDKSNFGDYMPFVKPGDIAPFSQIQFRAEGLSQKGVGLSRLIKKDSVLMVCIGASIGKTGYADRDCTCNQQINALTPKGFSGRYLYYLLSSEKFKTKLIDESGQTTLPIISKSKWENLRVFVLEALDEQREIVKRLDFLSEKIKLLDQNYTKQIADCVEMRQAILREAFEGRL